MRPRTVAIALTLLSLPACETRTPGPSTPPALVAAPPSHLMERCPKLPTDARPGLSRDEDIARHQALYNGCAAKVDGWVAYWRLMQQSVEASE